MSEAPRKLSTSALAKQLELPVQQLFAALKDYGWIRKVDDGWVLTGKGEFEGGEYVHSKRYGRYIVWPESLQEHRLIQGLETARLYGPSALGKTHGISGREINRLLVELGWQRRVHGGWVLTERGEELGGVQLDSDNDGLLHVGWPESVRDDPEFQRLIGFCEQVTEAGQEPERDLFSGAEAFESLDGHRLTSPAHLRICHWLYFAGVVHATDRRLPGEEEHHADFFLPEAQVYIEFWDDRADAHELSGRMAREEIYRAHGLKRIEIHGEDLPRLDEVLTRQLHKLGVRLR